MTPWVDEKFMPPRNEGRVPEVTEYLAEHEPSRKDTGEDIWPLERDRSEAAPNVPLETQLLLFWCRVQDAEFWVHDYLRHNFDKIAELAEERLRQGFKTYGSSMFGKTPEERLRDIDEEFADVLVYFSSGPLP